MSHDIETMVIGAGVVGLAIARALSLRGHEVMVLEQHGIIGSEVSSRNSEVIHAGIYYPTGSLRAKLCVAGKAQMYRFCDEMGVSHSLVATSEDQLPKLKSIVEQARRNGVDDLVPLTAKEARVLEPEVACAAAMLSPSTGIVDSHGFMLALQGAAEANGAQVVLNAAVAAISALPGGGFAVDVGGDTAGPGRAGRVTCRSLVTSAGLHASKLARTMTFASGYAVPETYYAKGQYYALEGRSPFQRHVYPMPAGAWLGLHATVDIGGRCKFGPDIAWIPEVDYGFEPEKLTQFLDFIRSYYPGLDASRLHADYTGIRPKLYQEGEAVPDFRFDGAAQHGLAGLVMLFGIESPGLTSSMAIGDHVADVLAQGNG
jgi:L-2-hydroxyglutarate oxidase LhgO